MNDVQQVFGFLAGETGPTALVTVTGVSGSSTRNPGAHMAVAGDGRFAGSLSGGCIEAAVVAEALATIAYGRPRSVRFGEGSPFIDIRLPCGGGVDVLLTPLADAALGRAAAAKLADRTPFVLDLPLGDGEPGLRNVAPEWRTCADAAWFRVAHLPPLAVVILGHGGAVAELALQATAFGATVRVWTPDRDLAARLAAEGVAVERLDMPAPAPIIVADRWTAFAFLFHDHDWEPALLAAALASDAFYIGAMGSRATHARRLALLAGAGVSAAAAERVHAPIGLIASSRDPQALALSSLAEIVRDFGTATVRPDR